MTSLQEHYQTAMLTLFLSVSLVSLSLVRLEYPQALARGQYRQDLDRLVCKTPLDEPFPLL